METRKPNNTLMKDQVQLSDKTKLSMPIANLIGLIMIVASVVFMYSEITGRLTSLETSREYLNQTS